MRLFNYTPQMLGDNIQIHTIGCEASMSDAYNFACTLPKDEKALVNELGTESIIRDGVWSLIPGKMHLENLKKDDIILNAKQTEELLKYGYINGDLTPFYIKIDDATFEELKEYFNHTTEYEEVLWNNDVSILNAILGIYRKDPKNWEL